MTFITQTLDNHLEINTVLKQMGV